MVQRTHALFLTRPPRTIASSHESSPERPRTSLALSSTLLSPERADRVILTRAVPKRGAVLLLVAGRRSVDVSARSRQIRLGRCLLAFVAGSIVACSVSPVLAPAAAQTRSPTTSTSATGSGGAKASASAIII